MQEQEQDDDDDGWNGFKWGMGRFSWGFGQHAQKPQQQQQQPQPAITSAIFPTRTDLDRNFGSSDDDSEEYFDAESDPASTANSNNQNVEYAESPAQQYDEDPPLYPGLYRALYAFEPEGTAEMRLVEDQIVRVVGRGGGVGWAVVVASDEADVGGTPNVEGDGDDGKSPKHALVPESYLEPWKLDEGFEYEEDSEQGSQH